MKKLAFFLASAGLLAMACTAVDSKLTESIDEAVTVGATYEALEEGPGTKSTISDEGVFAWSAGDSFQAYTTGNQAFKTFTLANGANTPSANFVGIGISGKISGAAVTPATLSPSWNGTTLTVNLPETIKWVAGEADPYMVASGFADGAKSVSFRHIGGLLKFTVHNVPVGSEKFAVTVYGARITGNYNVDLSAPVVNAETGTSVESTVTFTFTAVAAAENTMVFYLPVPAMSYNKVKIECLDGQDNVLASHTSSEAARTVERKQIRIFPAITFMGGSGEDSGSVVKEIPAGFDGAAYLPATTDNVTVNVNNTEGTISLEYPSEVSVYPAKIFIVVKTGTVATLNINLPESTVYVNGETSTSVTTLSAVTAEQTLVIKSGATVGSLTINQGNAEIEGKVETVTVQANQDQGTTPIEVFVANTAAIQTISLETKAEVTVEQPQNNIDVEATDNKVNVIVEPGAAGSTATARNGGDIYVTANADCAVIATGTDDSGDNASSVTIASVDANVEVTAVKDEDGVINNASDKDIDTKDYVAKIVANDNTTTYYLSLKEAVEAAQSGDTIELIADDDVSLTDGSELKINIPLTITGATDSYGDPKYTVYGQSVYEVNKCPYNDIYFNSTSGTITISNICFSGFGNGTAGSYNGRAPLLIGSNNNDAVIENVFISDINTEAMHINGGSFLIKDCAFDCDKEGSATSVFTRGIQVTNSAHGTIKNTAISNTVAVSSVSSLFDTAPVELIGSGAIVIEDCTLSARDEDNEKTAGIAVTHCADQPGSSQVTVKNCEVTAYVALFGDGDSGALITVVSGEYNGCLVQGDNGTGLTITGGLYTEDPSDYVAPGYYAKDNGNETWTVEELDESNAVAKIGDTLYATLAAAFAAAQDEDTITLLKDVTLTQAVAVNNDVSLNLDTHTITANINGNRAFRVAGVTFNVTNGVMVIPDSQKGCFGFIDLRDINNIPSSSATVTMEDVTMTGATCGGSFVMARTHGQTISLKNVNATATYGDGTEGHGSTNGYNASIVNCNNYTCDVTIEGGTFNYSTRFTKSGVFQVGLRTEGVSDRISNVTLKNVTVDTEYGPVIECHGNVTVEDCDFKLPAVSENEYDKNGIAFANNALVTIKSGSYQGTKYGAYMYNSGANVTINGGTFTGSEASLKADYSSNYSANEFEITVNGGTFNGPLSIAENVTLTITGGTFTSDPSAYLAVGYVATFNNNVWTVGLVPNAVAVIGSTGYSTLAAAVDAAEEEQTVTIIKAGKYDIPAITKTIYIEAAVSGVEVNHTTNSVITTIAPEKTAFFKNITFNLGTEVQTATAHGFGTLNGDNGAIQMENCTINGALNLFGDSSFINCTFNASGIYNIWATNGDDTYFDGCTFNNTNRAVNVYNQKTDSEPKVVGFDNCSFNGTEQKKAAINIHHNPNGTAAIFGIYINNCATYGTWTATVAEAIGEKPEQTVCTSSLWMVSDIIGDGGSITVFVDDNTNHVCGETFNWDNYLYGE